jgi:hypothetical protein
MIKESRLAFAKLAHVPHNADDARTSPSLLTDFLFSGHEDDMCEKLSTYIVQILYVAK